MREHQSRQKRADRYSHFPFVGQQLVEKHREQMTDQLKNDLESFMDHK